MICLSLSVVLFSLRSSLSIIRDDPVRELSERQKDRKRWHQRKAAGSVKLVGELSERDVIIGLRYWPSNVHVESMSASESTCVDETLSQYF